MNCKVYFSNMTECVICLENTADEGSTCLPCTHRFHTNCINEWFQHEYVALKPRSCPVCRTAFIDVAPLRRSEEQERIIKLSILTFIVGFHIIMVILEAAFSVWMQLETCVAMIQLPFIRMLICCFMIYHYLHIGSRPLVFVPTILLFPSQVTVIFLTYPTSLEFAVLEPILTITFGFCYWLLCCQLSVPL